MAGKGNLFGPPETVSVSATPAIPANAPNPKYFGYTPVRQTFDLTALVDEAEGARRNLPQIQFEISTPRGKRVFVTYRGGLDPVGSN